MRDMTWAMLGSAMTQKVPDQVLADKRRCDERGVFMFWRVWWY